MHDDDPIPLYDGVLLGSAIIPEKTALKPTAALRSRRGGPRKGVEHVHICYSPDYESGRVNHAECPVINISNKGVAIEFDEPLKKDQRGTICYRAATGRPVHVGCVVRHCRPIGGGLYHIGLNLDRKLQVEEMKPARVGVGREVAPGVRTRKLRRQTDAPADETNPI